MARPVRITNNTGRAIAVPGAGVIPPGESAVGEENADVRALRAAGAVSVSTNVEPDSTDPEEESK